MKRPVIVLGSLIAAIAVAIAALGMRDAPAAPGGRLDVVAAENVYGDIASQIGGRHVAVTSIMSNPSADPHLFQPGTANGLAVSTAGVVIQNGLGYDAFMQKLEDASPSSRRIVVTMADVLGVRGAAANPHLWYDVPRLDAIGSAIATALERADPAHASSYRDGLRRFEAGLQPLDREVASIRRAFAGQPVAYTEPVPGYLLDAAGLRNVTPGSFARAIEDGTDPTPQAVSEMLSLIAAHRIRVLLYNSQTVSPITTRITADARSAGIPVIGVSETLPPGMTFQGWQLSQAAALQRALAG